MDLKNTASVTTVIAFLPIHSPPNHVNKFVYHSNELVGLEVFAPHQ